MFQSEERGKDDNKTGILRPAGSSPCVLKEGFSTRDQPADPEQGIYHGFYRLGVWICIADKDVWRRAEAAAALEGMTKLTFFEKFRFLNRFW